MPPAAVRTVNVLAGAGQDTVAAFAYFPSEIRTRAGDTVTWKQNMDEAGGVVFSSAMAPMPPFLPVPGGGPTDLMINPQVAFPTRAPGAPVETFDGTGSYTTRLGRRNTDT